MSEASIPLNKLKTTVDAPGLYFLANTDLIANFALHTSLPSQDITQV